MDVSLLHTLTEDLAALLSEVTSGDLLQPSPDGSGDLGDLYLRLIAQNVTVVGVVTGVVAGGGTSGRAFPEPRGRAELRACPDGCGACGLDSGYRRSAHLLVAAFAEETDRARLYEMPGLFGGVDLTTLYAVQVRTTLSHIWDVAESLGLPYRPFIPFPRRVLRGAVSGPLV